jgi:Na+-translocating ferredoxin:NAD+ oxidoreductase subunit D
MDGRKKLIVSHAPFWHIGSAVPERNYNTILAAIPAVLMGLIIFGAPALAVISLSVASAILWELLVVKISKRPNTVGDGNAALIGLLFGMLLPASAPWWLVITGTFLAVVIGKQMFGGMGANPFSPAVLSYAILFAAWRAYFDFDFQLTAFDVDYAPFYPLMAAKAFGTSAIENVPLLDLFIGRELGGVGSTSAVALLIGGIYLILRGFVRWEIPVSFLAAVFVTAGIFHMAAPGTYAGPVFHLLTGYTLIAAFFLATDDSASPVNIVPMLIYGALGGVMTILIRNTGAYADGAIYAVLLINLMNPLIDKIRPKALGKVA